MFHLAINPLPAPHPLRNRHYWQRRGCGRALSRLRCAATGLFRSRCAAMGTLSRSDALRWGALSRSMRCNGGARAPIYGRMRSIATRSWFSGRCCIFFDFVAESEEVSPGRKTRSLVLSMHVPAGRAIGPGRGFLRSEAVATKSKKMQKRLRNLFSQARDGEGREVRRAAPAAPAQVCAALHAFDAQVRCAVPPQGRRAPALDAQVPRAARVELAGAQRWTRCARAGAPLCTRCARWTRDAPRRARSCGPARAGASACYSAGSASSTRRMSSCWLWTFVFL